uniref:DNA transposase THAP9like [Danio rerio] n=1 Tax=Lepeophtheirus salmonis TaxID=72036 RepID=A0A0K2T4P1_LEPSM
MDYLSKIWQKTNLVRTALSNVYDTGIIFPGIKCDGPSYNALVAVLCPNNMETTFPHPSNPEIKIAVIFDICHMMKLARKTFASFGVKKNQKGEDIRWRFINELYLFQKHEGLNAETKLQKTDIEWRRMKMKVNLACQTLPRSVADALDMLSKDFQDKAFSNCTATVEFIRIFEALFDIFNSRNILGSSSKAPFI